MKLESQVCSLELSKRLKELGVKQESLFYHCSGVAGENMKLLYCIGLQKCDGEYYSAFTVAELGEMLPCNHFNFYKNEDGYLFSMAGASNITCESEADARAKLLIYLLENKLLAIPKLADKL